MFFEIEETEEAVVLTTARLRVVFSRFPWQVRAYANGAEFPFFAERIDDRAYGPAYEVPPLSIQSLENGRRVCHEAVAVQPGEAFYGFGEQFNALDKWGREIVSWAIDCGNVTSTRSYKNVPFFMSSAGYGLFIHSSAPIVYRIGSESAVTYSFDVLDDELDYFLIYGPRFKHILARYTALTGRAPLPPKWSFGFWISRCGYKTRAEVEAVIEEMRTRGFPCDVISLDPWWMGEAPWCSYEWDTEQFPDPQEMMAELREQGVRTCLWITPYATPGTRAYEEGLAQGTSSRMRRATWPRSRRRSPARARRRSISPIRRRGPGSSACWRGCWRWAWRSSRPISRSRRRRMRCITMGATA